MPFILLSGDGRGEIWKGLVGWDVRTGCTPILQIFVRRRYGEMVGGVGRVTGWWILEIGCCRRSGNFSLWGARGFRRRWQKFGRDLPAWVVEVDVADAVKFCNSGTQENLYKKLGNERSEGVLEGNSWQVGFQN